ncbi:hypothetical protein Gohar_002409 [Gossypium harknessii]|uniref:GATA-type domain-containing protein n=1 Tax=Gossypium harknessii TaxID=34285 RepID=A0A7J9HKQ1_9ROSI|nr:hypothetical protein [Gossypium harknessii]
MSSSNCYSSLYPFPFDLNEDDQHQHHHLFTFKSQPSSSSSSSTVHHLAAGSCQREPQEFQDQAKIYVSKDGALENSDCGLKLSLWKKEERIESDHHHEDSSTKWMPSKLRILRKMMSSHHTDLSKSSSPKIEDQKLQNQPSPSPDNSCNSSYNNDINNSPIRVCADCNTTKTPLWRSGPRGPKSLCNACGIRQRKARQAMAAAAAATASNGTIVATFHLLVALQSLCNACGIRQRKARRAMAAAAAATASNGTIVATETTTSMKNKVQNKAKRSSNGCVAKLKNKKCKLSSQSQGRNKLCFEDLRIILSKSSAFHGVFPQDEKEAAILLMALSYGLVHG